MNAFEIEIPIGKITGLRQGEAGAPKVLALHGWLDNAASFVPMAPHLRDLDLVAVDLPGHGSSAHLPLGVAYTFELAVLNVLDIADALGWTEFHLLGHSMGAGIASLVAASAPERVLSLVCIEALGGLAEEAGNTAQRMRESVASSRAMATRSLRVFPDIAPAIKARMVANNLSEPAARLLVERGLKTVPGGFQWRTDQRLTVPTWLRPVDAQIEDVLAHIDCPTQVIFATPAQPYLPDEVRQRYVAQLKQGSLALFEGTHHLHMEMPADIASVIMRTFENTAPNP